MFEFRTPQYILRDPEAIKRIAVKGFDHFEDHRIFTDENVDKLWGNNLAFMKGEKWRQMRATVSPAFTGSKMRQMFELVADKADEIVAHFLKRVENGEKLHFEMKEFFSRYTIDTIASCAFGLKVDSFAEPDNEFYINSKAAINFSSVKQLFKLTIAGQLPKVATLFGLRLTDKAVADSF